MFSTLGIEQEIEQEQDLVPVSADRSIISNKRKTKKSKKPRVSLNVANILQSYDSNNCFDESEESDEVDEYFRMKLSINPDESILKWWKNRSTIFPR